MVDEVPIESRTVGFAVVYTREIDEINKRRHKLGRPKITLASQNQTIRAFVGFFAKIFSSEEKAKAISAPIYKKT